MYKEFLYTPGTFPKHLRSILDTQNDLLQKAIIETRIDCEKQCGIYEYVTVSCRTCNLTVTACFGYHCRTAEEWQLALKSIPEYVKQLTLNIDRRNFHKWPNNTGTGLNRFVLWQPEL